MKKVRIDLGLTIDFESIKAFCETNTFERHVYDAMRGKGDNRKGINMKADIGWYVANKIEENLPSQGLGEYCKVTGHSMQIKRVNK